MRKKKSAARARKEVPTLAAIRKRSGEEPKPLSLKTINNVLTVLSKLLAVAEEQRVIEQAPRVRLFAKLPKPPFDFLTFEEAERLSNAAEPEWRALLLVVLKAGLRARGADRAPVGRRGLPARQTARPPYHLARCLGLLGEDWSDEEPRALRTARRLRELEAQAPLYLRVALEQLDVRGRAHVDDAVAEAAHVLVV
jgi:hypothetical protein